MNKRERLSGAGTLSHLAHRESQLPSHLLAAYSSGHLSAMAPRRAGNCLHPPSGSICPRAGSVWAERTRRLAAGEFPFLRKDTCERSNKASWSSAAKTGMGHSSLRTLRAACALRSVRRCGRTVPIVRLSTARHYYASSSRVVRSLFRNLSTWWRRRFATTLETSKMHSCLTSLPDQEPRLMRLCALTMPTTAAVAAFQLLITRCQRKRLTGSRETATFQGTPNGRSSEYSSTSLDRASKRLPLDALQMESQFRGHTASTTNSP